MNDPRDAPFCTYAHYMYACCCYWLKHEDWSGLINRYQAWEAQRNYELL